MVWKDLEQARMLVEVGLGQPVGYTAHEERLIATHEAGHAAVAWLVAPTRRLEILTIVKRASALGLLAHGDREDVYTRSRSELLGMVQIAFGGQVAEELFFGDVSTGPGGDLAFATGTAAQMVGAAGMGDSLVSHAGAGGGPFSGGLVSQVLGDRAAREQVERCCTAEGRRPRPAVAATVTWWRRCATPCSSGTSSSGEITDVLEAAAEAGPSPLGTVPGPPADRSRGRRPAPGGAGTSPLSRPGAGT